MSKAPRTVEAAAAALSVFLLLAGVSDAGAQAMRTGWWGVFTPVEGPLFDGSTGNAHRQRPPLKGEFAKRYDETLAKLKRGETIDDPVDRCVSAGVPRVNLEPRPLEILVTPERTWIFHEHRRTVRLIHTDGSAPPDDPVLTLRGHSVGRWEGGTLVVETTGFRDNSETVGRLEGGRLVLETKFDYQKGIDKLISHSDQFSVTERIRLRDADTLENEITVRDSKALSRPWKTVRTYKRQPNLEIEHDNCDEIRFAANPRAGGPP